MENTTRHTKIYFSAVGEYKRTTGSKIISGFVYNATKEEAIERAISNFRLFHPRIKPVKVLVREENEKEPTHFKI